jgi:hypothetical protein
MVARAVDDAALRLRELRREEWGNLGLGGLALAAALVATRVSPSLAVPLFAGGLVVVAGGVRAVWRRWDLLDRLAADRDAYVIAEVRAFAEREATMTRRRAHAASVRVMLRHPGPGLEARLGAASGELEALAGELDDEWLALDPASAVACTRLLDDHADSPLLNPALPPEDLRARIGRIRGGFAQRSARPAP